RGVYQENSGSAKYDRNVWNYDPVNLTLLSMNPGLPTLSYLFGEIKRGKDGKYYIPQMGAPLDKFHSFSSTAFSGNVSITDTLYALSSSLPTQVHKVYNNSSLGIEYKRDIGL